LDNKVIVIIDARL